MSARQNGVANRPQSADGESLPDDVFQDDDDNTETPPTPTPPTSSTSPPKPLRVSGSGGIAAFLNKNTKKIREIGKRPSSESETASPTSLSKGSSKSSSKSTSDSKGGGGRRWSFKGGKAKRQQSVPVDVNLAGSGRVRSPSSGVSSSLGTRQPAENGSVTGLTSNESCLSSSSSVSPQPSSHSNDTSIQDDSYDSSSFETKPTDRPHPPPPASSSGGHSSVLDLETVHEGVETNPESKHGKASPPHKPTTSSGSNNESKPSPMPRQQQRPKLYSDSQVLAEGSKSGGRSKSRDGNDSGSSKRGVDTLERENILLREQLKLLKGQNVKLKKENKEYRSKLRNSGEWDIPSSPSSYSESVSPYVTSPRDSPQYSEESSRLPSESPSHEVLESGQAVSPSVGLHQPASPSAGNSSRSNREVTTCTSNRESSEAVPLRQDNQRLEKEEVDGSELKDEPVSLPLSGGIGRGVVTSPQSGLRPSSVPSTFTSKPKPIPIPRSVTVNTGGSGDIVKATDGKVTHGFSPDGKSLKSEAITSPKQVELDSPVPKPESPVPKPRPATTRTQVGVESSGGVDKESEKPQGKSDLKEKDKLVARQTLQSLLPVGTKQPTTSKPTPIPRSSATKEQSSLQKSTGATSPVKVVGMVTLGERTVSPEKVPAKSSSVKTEGESKEPAPSDVSPSAIRTSVSPITKPLPPLPTKGNVTVSAATPPKGGVVVTSPPSTATAAGGKDQSGSASPGVTKTTTTRLGTGYKKITIQSDTSWINRRKATENEHTDGASEVPASGVPSLSQQSASTSGSSTPTAGSQSPATGRPVAPYRSHTILPGPSPTTSKTSLLSPGMTSSSSGTCIGFTCPCTCTCTLQEKV